MNMINTTNDLLIMNWLSLDEEGYNSLFKVYGKRFVRFAISDHVKANKILQNDKFWNWFEGFFNNCIDRFVNEIVRIDIEGRLFTVEKGRKIFLNYKHQIEDIFYDFISKSFYKYRLLIIDFAR